MKVPFVDLGIQHAPVKGSFVEAFEARLEASGFILGKELEAFEREFAAFQKAPTCAGVGNGTDALALALEALGLEKGSGVVTVPNTFSATGEAIRMAGCVPVFVDIDPTTFNMDPRKLEDRLSGRGENNRGPSRISAVLPVHLYGRLADMDSILEVARRHSVRVVEDACQAHGAERGGKRAGAFGVAAAFSFYPTKNLGALGDAGAVVTFDSEIDANVRALRDYGRRVGEKYLHHVPGRNSRLDEIQAAFLRIKLERLEAGNRARREAASLYRRLFAEVDSVRLPEEEREPGEHVYHLFVVRVPRDRRDGLMRHLQQKGVGTLIHYPVPLHLQPSYRPLGHGPGDFPESERAAEEILSLPIYPGITEDQVRHVAATVGEFFARKR